MRNACLALCLFLLTGCGASYFSASTTSCYKSGVTELCYSSTKNQENFKAKIALYPDGTLKSLDVQTTATTAEAAIAASAEAAKTLSGVVDGLLRAGAMGAGS